MTAPLFDPTFLRKLERLSLVARRARQDPFRGDRRSVRRGQSIEFADYRNYVRGDDLRALDWNIYARLERPFIKLFEEEIEQTVHILLDASGSMDWPPAPAAHHKWQFARRLAVALGYIALAGHDRLFVAGLSAAQPLVWGPHRRRRALYLLLQFLGDLPAQGETRLGAALTRYAGQTKRPGLLFIISDFLTADPAQAGLSALRSAGYETTVLHLLSPDEVTPTLTGDLQLQDVETGRKQDVGVNSTLKRLYREQFAAWQGDLTRHCAKWGINYALVSTATPFEQIILQHLRRRGWVR